MPSGAWIVNSGIASPVQRLMQLIAWATPKQKNGTIRLINNHITRSWQFKGNFDITFKGAALKGRQLSRESSRDWNSRSRGWLNTSDLNYTFHMLKAKLLKICYPLSIFSLTLITCHLTISRAFSSRYSNPKLKACKSEIIRRFKL